MRRRVRTACKIAPNKKNGDKGMELLYHHTLKKQQKQIENLTELVKQQSEMMKQLVSGQQRNSLTVRDANLTSGEVGIQGNGNQTDNRKINTNVFINIFGKEGLDHITTERIKEILKSSLETKPLPSAASAAVLKTAMMAYSDPDHPENLTCYLPNKKTQEALIHTKEGWEVQPTNLVLPPMANTSINALFDRQPFEQAEEYGDTECRMKEPAENEKRYSAGDELKPVLVQNKALLQRALKSLPLAGAK
jgi:hypothetical protein